MTRTEITRLRDKGSTDRAALDLLLDTCIVGHFGVVDESGHPVVIPTAIVRDGDVVLAHGSTGSRWMRRLAAGAHTCLTVTAMDGMVIARSAFESSVHYRSAVLFGSCAPVTDTERALDLITERLVPGRSREIRRPRPAELAATLVLSLPISEWSLKISDRLAGRRRRRHRRPCLGGRRRGAPVLRRRDGHRTYARGSKCPSRYAG